MGTLRVIWYVGGQQFDDVYLLLVWRSNCNVRNRPALFALQSFSTIPHPSLNFHLSI